MIDKSNNLCNAILKQLGIPAPIAEYKFCDDRKWRADYAWPDVKLIVEIEGGLWLGYHKKNKDEMLKWMSGKRYGFMGRHNSPMGYIKDMEKYDMMVELGWAKLSYQPNKVDYDQIKRTYERLKNESIATKEIHN